ncbi:hypothetical protein [Devosia sp.]|uniref:hypothetical protein n=1 Tax=Devosia sp. TaxID=1871048 RepID=UPI00262CF86F|nr:hypothetical protein [Devosia sp.]
MREAIRRATNKGPFPDGSVVQHDWIREKGFAASTIADAGKKDGIIRIAFLRPQDAASGVGHVVIVHQSVTYESHGGTGPNSREWTGSGRQTKAKVYILSSAVRFRWQHGLRPARERRIVHGQERSPLPRHRLQGLEQFAANDRVGDELKRYGFKDIRVTGGGRTRTAEVTWDGPDTTAQIDPHLTNILELRTDPT